LNDYAEIRNVTIPDAVHLNARLLCVELARRTQPFGDKASSKLSGEKAITRDLIGRGGSGKVRAGIFASLPSKIVEYEKSENVRLFVTKNGDVYGTDKFHIRPNASLSEMRGFHKTQFANGKMSSAGGKTKDVGRWKFIDKMFVPKQTLEEYTKLVKDKVGISKAGWASCALKLKKIIAGQQTRGIPSWVVRQTKDYNNADVIDITNDLENPRVSMTNKIPWASIVCPPIEVVQAQMVVGQKMKNQMAQILKKRNKVLVEL